MKAFILAAGMGTRLKPITDTMPKALVPYCGTPLLERQITTLKDAGYDEFIINVHHFADMVEEFVQRNYGFGCRIRISDERDLLRETGGALRHAAGLIGRGGETLLVHNVDIVTDLDYRTLKGVANAAASLVVSSRDTARYLLFDSEMKLAGWTNVSTGEVKIPSGRGTADDYRKLAFSGIHFTSPDTVAMMASWPEKFSIIDFYLSICDKCPVYGIDVTGHTIKDVGKLADIGK